MVLVNDLLNLLDRYDRIQVYTDFGLHSDIMSVETLRTEHPAVLKWEVKQLDYEAEGTIEARFVITAFSVEQNKDSDNA